MSTKIVFEYGQNENGRFLAFETTQHLDVSIFFGDKVWEAETVCMAGEEWPVSDEIIGNIWFSIPVPRSHPIPGTEFVLMALTDIITEANLCFDAYHAAYERNPS